MPKFSVTLTRDQLALLRQMTGSVSGQHMTACVNDYLKADTDQAIDILEYIGKQALLQAAVQRTLATIMQQVIENGAISATLEVSEIVLDWLVKVSRVPRLDPASPDIAKAAINHNLNADEYSDLVFGLRGALKAAVSIEDAPEPAKPNPEDNGEFSMKPPKGFLQ